MGEYADSLSASKKAAAAKAAAQKRASEDQTGRAAKAKVAQEAAKYKAAGPDYKGAGYIPSKAPEIPQPVSNPKSKPKPKDVTVTTSSVVPRQSSISDGVNTKDLYQKAVLKIMLSLIRSSKDLLTRYNFSGIDKIVDFYLDADNAARQTAVITQIARPKTLFTLTEVQLQDAFSRDINAINNKIGDLVDDATKISFYGSNVGDTFFSLTPKILNGNAYYDLKFTIESATGKAYKYSLYEIA